MQDRAGESRRRKQTLGSLGVEQMEPREGREEEERGSEGGRRGEAHNAMGHGGWTDSICSQLSVAPVMDGELERHMKVGERGRRGWEKKREDDSRKRRRVGEETKGKVTNRIKFLSLFSPWM